mmetsp:Transcript_10342/g.25007  ORF Transcript_10342/g.25007 Transcript_10342/m.25007 type:complete len:81 (+) Transcript_10342:265-507(+)
MVADRQTHEDTQTDRQHWQAARTSVYRLLISHVYLSMCCFLRVESVGCAAPAHTALQQDVQAPLTFAALCVCVCTSDLTE